MFTEGFHANWVMLCLNTKRVSTNGIINACAILNSKRVPLQAILQIQWAGVTITLAGVMITLGLSGKTLQVGG